MPPLDFTTLLVPAAMVVSLIAGEARVLRRPADPAHQRGAANRRFGP
jgi:hypothetical protein